MTESISKTNYFDIKFTRDTKVDYQKGNAVINTIFKKFDKDLSGDFNNEEWANYSDYLLEQTQIRKLVSKCNNSTTQYYDSKIRTLVEQYDAINETAKDIDFTAFDKLLEFEENHKLERIGCIDESIPEDKELFDISELGMGIYDKEKDCFTGECYQKGYILGLENLSKDERKEYIKLLEMACDIAKKGKAIDKKFSDLSNEFDKYTILLDYAEYGYIKGAVSEEKAQRLVEIYNNANPFYKEIKDIELKRQQLWLKGNKTEEDIRLLDQYDIQLRQLKEASSTWSISEAEKSVFAQLEKEGFSYQITPLQLTYQNGQLTNRTQGSFNYQNDNWGVESSFSNTIGVKRNSDIHHSYLANLDAKYAWDKLKLQSSFSVNLQEPTDDSSEEPTRRTISQSFDASYNNLRANIGEDIVTLKKEGTPDVTTYTTKAEVGYNAERFSGSVSGSVTPMENTEYNEDGEEVTKDSINYSMNTKIIHKIGVVTNTANIDFTSDSKKYSISSAVDYGTYLAENLKISSTSSFGSCYNSTLKSFELSPCSQVTLNYNNQNVSGNLTLSEQYSAVLAKDSDPSLYHNLVANAGFSYKGFSSNVKIKDSDNPVQHSNTYGIEVSKDFGKYGRIGLEGFYERSNDKEKQKITEKYMVSASYKLTF